MQCLPEEQNLGFEIEGEKPLFKKCVIGFNAPKVRFDDQEYSVLSVSISAYMTGQN